MMGLLIILVAMVLAISWISMDRSSSDIASKVLTEQSQSPANPMVLLGSSTDGKTTTVFYKNSYNQRFKSVCLSLNEGGWRCEHGPDVGQSSFIK